MTVEHRAGLRLELGASHLVELPRVQRHGPCRSIGGYRLVGPTLTTGFSPSMRNEDDSVVVPAGVVIEIGPVVAPTGTTAVSNWSLTTTNDAASVSWNFTDVVPVKCFP